MPNAIYNTLAARSAQLTSWIKRYPNRAAGWGYMPPTLALAGSGLFKVMQGEIGSGISLLASAAADAAGNTALIRYGDPEISRDEANAHTEIQDQSLWHRLTSPRQAPNEFSAVMGSLATSGLIASAIAQPNLVNVTMAASCVVTVGAMMAAEKDPATLPQGATSLFNRMAERSRNWVQERPLRTVFWTVLPCNIAQMVDGYQRGDKSMFISGLLFMTANALRSRSSKRTRVIGDVPKAAG